MYRECNFGLKWLKKLPFVTTRLRLVVTFDFVVVISYIKNIGIDIENIMCYLKLKIRHFSVTRYGVIKYTRVGDSSARTDFARKSLGRRIRFVPYLIIHFVKLL